MSLSKAVAECGEAFYGFFQIIIGAGVSNADKAFTALTEGAAGNADQLCFLQEAVAEVDTAQPEAADIGKNIECTGGIIAAHTVNVQQSPAARLREPRTARSARCASV